jgi:hypothetical protein
VPLPAIALRQSSVCQSLRSAAAPTAATASSCIASRGKPTGCGSYRNGCNGCTQRSLSFAPVRSLLSKWLQTRCFSEPERTGANARQLLPCRRSWVRVPSSALKFLQIGLCRRQDGKRWLQRGCIRARIEPDLCPGVDSCEVLDAVRAPNASDGLPASQEILSELEVRSSRFISSPRRSSAEFTDSCRRSSSVREREPPPSPVTTIFSLCRAGGPTTAAAR